MAGQGADSRVLRHRLIEQLRTDGHVRSARVAAAMAAVPREVFVPGVPLEDVYRASEAIVTKRLDGVSVSSASAPEIVALMLEQLDPQPGDRVLEIGAGTGYNAALLAHLVGDSGAVVTVDIDADLVDGAREHLLNAGYGQVKVALSDGALGSADQQQMFDRIILTVASTDLAPAWREQLARPHGRLVLPLGLRGPQRSVAFTHHDDHLVSDSVRNCAFIPLRGLLANGSARIPLDPDARRVLSGGDEPLALDVPEIVAQLKAPLRRWPTGVSVSFDEFREGLHLWLVTHQTGIYTLWGGPRVPDLFGLADRLGVRGTLCCLDSRGLGLLAWANEMGGTNAGGELCVLASVENEDLVTRLQHVLEAWDAAWPRDNWLEIRAYARGTAPQTLPDEVTVDQRWTRFVLKWAQPPAILTV